MNRPLAGAALVCLTLAAGAVANAGQAGERHRGTIGVGAGVADPLHADLSFTAPIWHAALGRRLTNRVWVEAAYSEWRHTDEAVHLDIQVQSLTGPLGRIGRLTERTEYVTRTVGANVILRGSAHRLILWGGGGPAYINLFRRYHQAASGCVGAVSCQEFSNTHNGNSMAVEAAAGADISVTSRIAIFGRSAFALPIRDPGSGHVAVTTGVRIGIW
jgi:hypothetical protein